MWEEGCEIILWLTGGGYISFRFGEISCPDPGHGGIDAGKTGVNGAEEKEINLKIALIAKRMLIEEDIPVIMTRESDDRLGDTQTKDLKERVKIMNESRPALVVAYIRIVFKGLM